MPKAKKSTKARSKTTLPDGAGHIHIYATFGNTIITITKPNGDTVAQSSAGAKGFKGSRKSTSFAGQEALTDALEKAKTMGLKVVDVFIKHVGQGCDSVRALIAHSDIRIGSIKDVTPLAHNGCKKRKKRRV